MSEKFQDKYRIPSARLRNWDYGWNGHYFITICTAGHDPYFGKIENKKMVLSEIGILVRTEWDKSFGLRSGLFCDAYVIMPNHIHAILRIDNDDFGDFVETHSGASLRDNDDASTDINDNFDDYGDYIETHSGASLPGKNDIFCDFETHSGASLQGNKSKFGVARRSPKSISSFVACFKSMVTMNARKLNSGFGWQSRFHDHIIRNEEEYQRIANYIENNPANWGVDNYK